MLGGIAYSQTDSLFDIYKNTQNSDKTLNTLREISKIHIDNKNYDSAHKYTSEYLNLAKNYNSINHLIDANFLKGKKELILTNTDSSYIYLKNAYDLIQKHKIYSKFSGYVYLNLARLNINLANYDLAYRFLDELNNLIKNNIINSEIIKIRLIKLFGLTNYYIEEYERADKYFIEGLKKSYLSKDSNEIADFYNLKFMVARKINQKDSAKIYLKKSLEISKIMQDTSAIATCYNNFSSFFYDINNLDSCIYYLRKAANLNQAINNHYFLAYNYLNIAEIYYNADKIDSTYHYYNLSRKLIEKKNVIKLKPFIYNYLSEYFESKGNLDSALYYSRKETAVNDTVYNENKSKAVATIEAKYKNQKTEREIELLKENIKLRNSEIRRNYFIIAAVVLFLLAILIIFYNKIKTNRIIRKQNKELIEKNDELSQTYEEITSVNNQLNDNQLKLTLALEKLKEANLAKDKFFSIISHDLKNPVTGLSLTTDILLNNYDDLSQNEVKYQLTKVKDTSDNLAKFLINLLEWSRTQTGRIDFIPMKNNLAELIEKSINILRNNIDEKDINLVTDFKNPIDSYIDKNMIETVIINLLSNAIKFTKTKGEIKISAKNQNGYIVIKIKDNGIGMSKNETDNLFLLDKTHSKKGTKNEKGTGLGLLIVKEFIDKHNGFIEVQSEPEKGSEFIIKLPFRDS